MLVVWCHNWTSEVNRDEYVEKVGDGRTFSPPPPFTRFSELKGEHNLFLLFSSKETPLVVLLQSIS